MKTYGQFCPVAKAAEIFAERWTPLIIRELLMGSRKFSELEIGMAHIPRSLLTKRLRTLEDAGVVVRMSEGNSKRAEYHLTEAGADLFDVVKRLGDWGQKWINHIIGAEDVDPALLMWDMHRRVNLDLLPPKRVVIQMTFHGAAKGDYWLVLERPEPSVCYRDPGLEVDLFINADTVAVHKVWMGMTSLAGCIDDGLIKIDGLSSHVKAFHLKLPRFVILLVNSPSHRVECLGPQFSIFMEIPPQTILYVGFIWSRTLFSPRFIVKFPNTLSSTFVQFSFHIFVPVLKIIGPKAIVGSIFKGTCHFQIAVAMVVFPNSNGFITFVQALRFYFTVQIVGSKRTLQHVAGRVGYQILFLYHMRIFGIIIGDLNQLCQREVNYPYR